MMMINYQATLSHQSQQSPVKKRDNKISLAQSFPEASNAKMLMFEKANQWEQVHQAKKIKLEAARDLELKTRAQNELAWAKEKFGLELQDQIKQRRLLQMEKWLSEGKTVAQIEILLRLATPAPPVPPAQPAQPASN